MWFLSEMSDLNHETMNLHQCFLTHNTLQGCVVWLSHSKLMPCSQTLFKTHIIYSRLTVVGLWSDSFLITPVMVMVSHSVLQWLVIVGWLKSWKTEEQTTEIADSAVWTMMAAWTCRLTSNPSCPLLHPGWFIQVSWQPPTRSTLKRGLWEKEGMHAAEHWTVMVDADINWPVYLDWRAVDKHWALLSHCSINVF